MGLTRKQVVMLIVLVSGTFITVLNQTLVNPALPSIMAETGVDEATVQWLTTGFTLVNAVMIPVTAYLTDRFKTKPLFIVSMLLFTLGSLLCGLAPNFGVLLAGRVVQAAGAGVLMPMVLTVLLLTFPTERRGVAMGFFGVIIMFAPAVGPTCAGVIVDHWGWHVMFYLVVALAALDVLVALFALPRQEKVIPDGLHLDKPSVLLSTVGFGGLLYGFSVVGTSGVSVAALVAVAIGAVVVVLFFRRQLRLEVPMLEVRVLKNRKFLVGTVIGMIIQASILANSVLIPVYVQTLCNQSATVSGLVLMPGAIIMGIMSPIAGRLFDKHGPRGMAILGTSLLALGTLFMCTLTTSTSMVLLGAIIALRNFAMILVNTPINTWCMNALDNKVINHGNAVNNTLRQVAGSLGTAIVISVYSLVAGACEAQQGYIEAHMTGINVAFGVQFALILSAVAITVLMVKDKPSDGAQSDPENERRAVIEAVMHRDVHTVPATATVGQAVQLFLDKGISAAPIVDGGGKVVGFVSDGDVMRALSTRGTSYTHPEALILSNVRLDEDARHKIDVIMDAPVGSIAVPRCVCVDVHADIFEVCRVLGENHLKKVPVTDGGRIVGIVNRSDITASSLQQYLERRADAEGSDAP